MKIELPWFNPCLMPNDTSNRWTKAKARKKQRAESNILTKSKLATFDFKPRTERLAVSIMFYQPTRHHRDLDGCLSAIKGALDGIADAILFDDKNFRPVTIDFGEVTKGGKIIINICENSVDLY
jgi:Holliday junction resolvase RusA-like endonuclease